MSTKNASPSTVLKHLPHEPSTTKQSWQTASSFARDSFQRTPRERSSRELFKTALTNAPKNLQAVLEFAGSSLEKMVEVNVFLSDMGDFEKMNEVYLEWFGEIKPVRTCVAVKSIPEYTDVEMKCVALL